MSKDLFDCDGHLLLAQRKVGETVICKKLNKVEIIETACPAQLQAKINDFIKDRVEYDWYTISLSHCPDMMNGHVYMACIQYHKKFGVS